LSDHDPKSKKPEGPRGYYEVPQPESVGTAQERAYLPAIFGGIGVAARHFFKNFFFGRDPNVDVLARQGQNKITTISYPEEKPVYPPGYRGMHRLVPREDGKPRCVACYMCATICPAQCIYIEAGEYPEDPIEKYPVRFEIDELRCVVCGLCVEACPKDAIRMDTGTHCKPVYDRKEIVYGIDRLLKGAAVSHESDVWFKRETSDPPVDEHAHPIPVLPIVK
jgi:NADH-quinone oxidoreductase subunit I